LANLIQSDPVPAILLTILQTIEQLVSDNAFALSDLPPGYVDLITHTLRKVLPVLKNVYMVKAVAGLCYILIEKGVSTNGEIVLDVLTPAMNKFARRVSTGGEAHKVNDKTGEDDVDTNDLTTFGMILQAAASGVRICADHAKIWALLEVVTVCTDPDNAATTWMFEYAWELLYAMCATATFHDAERPGPMQALEWCLRHGERDFEARNICVNCIAALSLILWPSLQYSTLELLRHVAVDGLLHVEYEPVCRASAVLADVLLLRGGLTAASTLLKDITPSFLEIADPEGDIRAPLMAYVLCRTLPILSADPPSTVPDSFVEKISLAIDSTGHRFMRCVMARGLVLLAELGLLSSDTDTAMVQSVKYVLEPDQDDDSAVTPLELYIEAFDLTVKPDAPFCQNLNTAGAIIALT